MTASCAASLDTADVIIAIHMLNQQRAITRGEETFTPAQVRNTALNGILANPALSYEGIAS